jgi:hypothetical protein
MPPPSRPKAILRRESLGALMIAAAGSALHFAFDWTGGWRPIALVAAVNESIWEHLKLAFWPGLAWAALVPCPGGAALRSRLAVRGFTLLLTAMLIVAVFTSYTAVLERNLLPLDIGTFVVAIVAGQMAAARLLAGGTPSRGFVVTGLALLALQLAAYGLFTFHPPDHWLFVEERTGLRGLPVE